MPAGILEFGDFELDCERFELRRRGTPLRLERQNEPAFDSLHTDPHYRSIDQRIGLPPAY